MCWSPRVLRESCDRVKASDSLSSTLLRPLRYVTCNWLMCPASDLFPRPLSLLLPYFQATYSLRTLTWRVLNIASEWKQPIVRPDPQLPPSLSPYSNAPPPPPHYSCTLSPAITLSTQPSTIHKQPKLTLTLRIRSGIWAVCPNTWAVMFGADFGRSNGFSDEIGLLHKKRSNQVQVDNKPTQTSVIYSYSHFYLFEVVLLKKLRLGITSC